MIAESDRESSKLSSQTKIRVIFSDYTLFFGFKLGFYAVFRESYTKRKKHFERIEYWETEQLFQMKAVFYIKIC